MLLLAIAVAMAVAETLLIGVASAQQASSSSPNPNCSDIPIQTGEQYAQPIANECSQAAISVSSISQDFGSVTIGTSSSPRTVTVTNTGTVPVNILDSFSENNPPYTVTLGEDCQNLQVGQSCQIQAIFQPRKSGPTTVIMTLVGRPVSGSLPDSPSHRVSLTGVGV